MKTKFVLFCMVSSMAISSIYSKELAQSNIFYEIVRGNSKAVSVWLKSKPDLSTRNEKGQTFLIASVLTGQRNLAKMFVKSGAQVNATDLEGKTALDYAVEYGHVKMICDLVKCGGKVTNSNNLYHLKSVMQDRAHSLIVRFAVLFLASGLIFMPFILLLAPIAMISEVSFGITATVVIGFGLFVYTPYFLSLPFRAYSWDKAVSKDWMLESVGTVSLN
jgi:ankyrin repeat protein